MSDDATWGEVRAWAHQDPLDHDAFLTLFAAIPQGAARSEMVRYVADHLSVEASDFDALERALRARYRERFEARVAWFRRQPMVTSVSFEPNPPVDEAVIARIECDWGRVLPHPIAAFYRSMDGFTMRWESTSNNAYAQGTSVFMNRLERVFGGFDGMNDKKPWDPWVFEDHLYNEWILEEIEEESPELAHLPQSSFWLESIEGTSNEVGLHFPGDGPAHKIVYFDEMEPFVSHLDFPTYMEWTLRLLGYSYWPYLFLEAPNGIHTNSVQPEAIAELFPDQRERLERAIAGTRWATP